MNPEEKNFLRSFLQNKKLQAAILFLLAVGIYSNTFTHEYVYDDIIVIQQNAVVQKGFAGIPDLLTKDSFYGYNQGNSDLTGGRYRPLSLITFAIEHELFGNNAPFEHIVSVLLYALCCVLLLFTLYKLLPNLSPLIIFCGALLFTLHPTHTEVVANIKSRDEILCLLFTLLTFFFWMKLQSEKKILYLIFSLASFALALLSKEQAILLLAWLPLAWWLNKEFSLKKISLSLLPFALVATAYLFIRAFVAGTVGDRVSTDIMNNPFLLATGSEKIATIFYVMLLYFVKTFYPFTLSYDYTYGAISYQSFSSPLVLISVLLFVSMIFWIAISVFKKQYHSLLMLIWLLPLILVSNLFFNVGAPMADRFLFMPSVGLCVMIAGTLTMIFKNKNQIAFAIVLAISLCFSAMTFSRNFDWKTNKSLFAADEPKVPNSVKATLNLGSILMSEADTSSNPEIKNQKLAEAFSLFKKGISIYPTADLCNHLGAYYNIKNNPDSSEYFYRKSLSIKPDFAMAKNNLLQLYQKTGVKFHDEKKEDSALFVFRKQVALDSTYVDSYNNIGTVFFSQQNFDSAEKYFLKTLTLQPEHNSAKSNLVNTYLNQGNIFFSKNNLDDALAKYQTALKLQSNFVDALANCGVIFMQKKNYSEAKKYFESALQYNPQHQFSRERLTQCESFLSGK
ncbi:MAG TPA: hypothetical protein DCQ93_00040 [Bacteroidetes bacterium]|nr:hypothetical protein [Bacteroidota bacterium]